MSKYLIREELTFRCDTVEEAKNLIESIKLKNYVVREEIVKIERKDDIYFRVKIKTSINDEREPFEAYVGY